MPLKAADQPVLNDKRKAMEWLLGNWEANVKDSPFGEFRFVQEVTSDLGGAVINFNYRVFDNNNNEVLAGIGIDQWRSEANSIVGVGAGTDGNGVAQLVKKTENTLVFQSAGNDSLGNPTSGVSEWTRIDKNTVEVSLLHQVTAGEPRPDLKRRQPEGREVGVQICHRCSGQSEGVRGCGSYYGSKHDHSHR